MTRNSQSVLGGCCLGLPYTLDTRWGSGATPSVTQRDYERIPYKMSVRKDRCARSILLGTCPSILRSQTRVVAPQEQEDLHAPWPASDPLHQSDVATWQPAGAKKEIQSSSPLSRSVKTRLDCADDGHESVDMITSEQ